MTSLRDALLKQLATLPLVTYSNGYQVQALPKADLLSLLNLHPDEDIKALVETGTKLGYELGRKEAGEEIADAITMYCQEWSANTWRSIAAGIARDLTSQPSDAAPEPLAASTGHSDLPEDARPPQEPCGCIIGPDHTKADHAALTKGGQ